MHNDDLGMVEHGDMSFNRKTSFIVRILFSLPSIRLSKSDRFKPDIYVEDGQDLLEYGFDAKIIHIPGHSKGSIGILTANGDLFCGDLFTNTNKPAINSIMDDKEAAYASIRKLKNLNVNTVYPGHGKPFPIDIFIKNIMEEINVTYSIVD
jgi:glyoxylase-like metal-dependent hydrolase (beta-lactamase superfamily II)